MIVHMLLEGYLEEPVARKLLEHCGHQAGTVFGKQGFGYIKTKARKFVPLVKHGYAVLVLTDLMDSGCQCPSQACRQYVWQHCGEPPPSFLCRFAVRELESWLLADREAIASFLRISITKIPDNPEFEPDPKRKVVELARLSPKTRLRDALVPSRSHGGAVGPGYRLTMTEFVNKHWSPEQATRNSPSLGRCIDRLNDLHSLP